MKKQRNYCQCEGQCGESHGRFHHCEAYEGMPGSGPSWVTLVPYGRKRILMCDNCRHASDRYAVDLKKRQLAFTFQPQKSAPPEGGGRRGAQAG